MEEEFRLAKNHTSLNKSKKLLIASEKLTSHFEQHFSPRPVTEIEYLNTIETFPIYSPQVNGDIPNEDELQKFISKQKYNKYQSIDKIYSKHLIFKL